MMLIYFVCAFWLPWGSSSFLNGVKKVNSKGLFKTMLFKRLVLNKETFEAY